MKLVAHYGKECDSKEIIETYKIKKEPPNEKFAHLVALFIPNNYVPI